MLGDNIQFYRKDKGFSQETFAQQLNVVRQTISKWEKGLSVPDAEMLNKISEVLEVPVEKLLGSTVAAKSDSNEVGTKELVNQLVILNEQLANQARRKRKILKTVLLSILAFIVFMILMWAICFYFFKVQPRNNATYSRCTITCELDGETYGYEMIYDENFRVYEEGGDSYISSHVLPDQYDDANVKLAQIEDYFTERGGTCTYETSPYSR